MELGEAQPCEQSPPDSPAAEVLTKARQELQQVFSAAAPLCVISLEHEILMINDSLCALLEMGPDQLQDWKCYDIFRHAACHTPDCPLHRMRKDPRRMQIEFALETVSGQGLNLLGRATPLFDGDFCTVTGVVVSFMDISAQKRTWEELRHANRELKVMQMHLVQSEKLMAIGQLAAGVAHEINTPVGFVASNFETLWQYIHKLCTIIDAQQKLVEQVDQAGGALQSLAREVQTLQKEMKLELVLEDLPYLFTESREGIERVTEIIQNLRDFSRIDQAEDLDSYDLNDGVKATLMVAHHDIKQNVEVELDLGDIPLVYGHCGQLNQVLLNIFMNAVQAIRLHASEQGGIIQVRTYAEGPHVVCEIKDNGPGIAEDVQAKIFDPFFTTKAVGQGTGLGLSIAHDIIANKHRGTLSVASAVGQGTTFKIQLPLDPGLHAV